MDIFLKKYLQSKKFLILYASFKRWLGGRVVMQRTATPCTPVRFRPQPPTKPCPSGEIGRHKGFKIPRSFERASSSLASGTI